MELLISKNPIVNSLHAKHTDDYVSGFVDQATCLNIATGYISNESIAELKRLVEWRKRQLSLSLLIGMNYIEGFTRLQYEAVRELGEYLTKQSLGNVYVSPKALYHGKMYSFLNGDECMGAFVGSSNLCSFMGKVNNYVEADMFLRQEEGLVVNQRIVELTRLLGEPVLQAKELTNFIQQPEGLLEGFDHVEKVASPKSTDYSGIRAVIPLKDEPKSNLNTYFGAGKIKGRFSRRDYYEVEIIISTKIPAATILPEKGENFVVVTEDGYRFACSRQGDYGKNFRSNHDLKILGKWIKGKMELAGALKIGEQVTEEVLSKFGKRNLVLTKAKTGDYWIMSLE